MHARQQYITHRQALLNAGWSTDQLTTLCDRLRGQDANGAVSCIRLLAASKTTPTQADTLLQEDWSNTTELRHAINRVRKPQVEWATSTTAPSQNSKAAATDQLWARYRRNGGSTPTRQQINTLALQLDQRRAELFAAKDVPVGTVIADDNNDCDNSPVLSDVVSSENIIDPVAFAKPTIPQPVRKTNNGRAEAEVTFNGAGTHARVPSSTGRGYYNVTLDLSGTATLCDCDCHTQSGGAPTCKHMKAAQAAHWICRYATTNKRSAWVELIPVKVSPGRRKSKSKKSSKPNRKRGAGSVASAQAA